MKRPGVAVAVALVLVLVVVVALTGRPPADGEPLDPTATGPLGTRALVLLLEELGAEVDIETGIPAEGRTALVLEDRLGEERRDELAGWVRAGGTLVVADPTSVLTPAVASTGVGALFGEAPPTGPGTCTIGALADLGTVDPSGGLAYEVGAGDRSCFGDGEEAFVVARPLGAGTVVALGGPGPLVNANLADQDHAVLAATLLVAGPGAAVVFLVPSRPGEGDEGLLDLIAPGVWLALAQLAIAYGLYAWFRARRVGRPVSEPVPVAIAGSELVVAVGELLAQSRSAGRAAEVLRADLRHGLARRLGLPATASDEVVAEAAARHGAGRDQVLGVLDPQSRPVADDRSLVALAREIEAIRQEVLHDD